MTAAEFKAMAMRDQINSMSEHELQSRCVSWFRKAYPSHAMLLMAIPNGGYREKKLVHTRQGSKWVCLQGQKLQEEGVIAGVPDLHLAIPSNGKAGLWIEMKKGHVNRKGEIVCGGKVSDEQKQMMRELTSVGNQCEVCWHEEQFKEIIHQYLRHNEQQREDSISRPGDSNRSV